MIFIDAHVHIYDCFDVDELLDSAWNNFEFVAGAHNPSAKDSSYVLLLTEGETEGWYQQQVAKKVKNDRPEIQVSSRWDGVFSGDTGLLMLYRRDCPHKKLFLVAGIQVVTAEKIEVLGLFCACRIKSGTLLTETVHSIQQAGGISVLPWGAGKWMGERGRQINGLLTDPTWNEIFPGDNGGRPCFWPAPAIFSSSQRVGTPVLSGTDPLPLPGEATRVGSFGFYIEDASPDREELVPYLKRVLLTQHSMIHPFGKLQKNWKFVVNQLRLRLAGCPSGRATQCNHENT